MTELDPFFDLPYLNAPGFGDADAGSGLDPQGPAQASPAPASDPGPAPPLGPAPPRIMQPGPGAPLPPNLQMPGAPPAARRRAGTAIVLAGVGAGAGALAGGLWGAGSGLLFAGATMNAYRAKILFGSGLDSDRGEAVKSTVMAVLGLGVASYLGYRAHQAARSDRDDDDDDD